MSDMDPDFEALIASDATRFTPGTRPSSSDALGAHVVNWRTLPDIHADLEWEALRAWVEWVAQRYNIPLSVIPNCWYRHPALVEELSALHTAHTVSFDSADTGLGPIGFHERLTLAHSRLTRAYGGGCNNGHQEVTPRAINTDEEDWTAWTSQAHAHRNT